MGIVKEKKLKRKKIKKKIRSKLIGNSNSPRLSVFRSSKHIYIQAIDDVNSNTICSLSSLSPLVKNGSSIDSLSKIEISEKVGEIFGKMLIDLKIDKAVFDRNGFIFHGRIKRLADSIRETGVII